MQLLLPKRKGKGLQSILLLLVCDIKIITKKKLIIMEIFGFISPFCTFIYLKYFLMIAINNLENA